MKVKFRVVMFRWLFSNLFLIFFCEFLVYYLVLYQCKWPAIQNETSEIKPVRAMFIADIHMLGPRNGHWLDKLRREWQMHRSFQTAITLLRPEIIFVLGDVFDEGSFIDPKGFAAYVERFKNTFYTPNDVILKTMAGNHDIGFHYATHPYITHRFDEAFNLTGVSLFSLRDVHFVIINSVGMEGKYCTCDLCSLTQAELSNIATRLQCTKTPGDKACNRIKKLPSYSRPVVLQHYPMYRATDESCIIHDSPVISDYRERWEVLSKESTQLIKDRLDPRLALSGHSHHFCHTKNYLDIDEYTVASFNWRNKNNPSFLLSSISPENYAIYKCDMPKESTVITCYIIGFFLSIIFSLTRIAGLIRCITRCMFGRTRVSYDKQYTQPLM